MADRPLPHRIADRLRAARPRWIGSALGRNLTVDVVGTVNGVTV